ncbi:MAG: reactive intermediate/imine deaminase [Gammaproteobacteria bacterium TMED30]|nr:reactive intermediate/imine deaminase [Gammaproteobacteria bacterium]OUU01752.1 MAG: reactive intermediate/imine deaminase [Gammaproteobacteria bacterium TMED30]
MSKTIIQTPEAPAAIGTYSQAVQTPAATMTFISGQIPLHPDSMTLVSEAFEEQAHRVFINLRAIAEAAGGRLSDCVKLTIYLTDLGEFATVNEVMATYFAEPYPARAAIEVSALPKQAQIEIDAIMVQSPSS